MFNSFDGVLVFSLVAFNVIHVTSGFTSALHHSRNSARPDTVLASADTGTSTFDHNKENRMDTITERPTGSLASLCDTTKQACFAVTPLVLAFYNSLTVSNTATKKDSSVFTIADGMLQHLFIKYLFSSKLFQDIVGEEEDECQVNTENLPYTVNDMIVPPEYTELIEKAKYEMAMLSQDIIHCDLFKSLTIFIDPIDGTKEFIRGIGEHCTICIGFANANGHPVAGVVYRPLNLPWAPHLGPTWAAGAKSECYIDCHLDDITSCSSSSRISTLQRSSDKGSLLTSNGNVSLFLVALMQTLCYERSKSGGAGNKMLMLLEGKGSAYIQDRGVSRWDTCAAQACLEAQGGILCKLTSFLSSPSREEGYTYLRSNTNLDFERGVANLNIYNSRLPLRIQKNDDPEKIARQANDVLEVKAYSNMCGVLALPFQLNTVEHKKKVLDAAKMACEISPPAYD